MNIHTREADNISLQDKADAALDVLRVWSLSASQDELAAMVFFLIIAVTIQCFLGRPAKPPCWKIHQDWWQHKL